MDVCFALAVGTVLLRLPSPVTLSWEHSVEHFAIEEVWQATPAGLALRETRVGGLGAGIDIPAQARLVDGAWRFTPDLPPQHEVQLADSDWARGYRVCAAGQCVSLPQRGPVTMSSCGP